MNRERRPQGVAYFHIEESSDTTFTSESEPDRTSDTEIDPDFKSFLNYPSEFRKRSEHPCFEELHPRREVETINLLSLADKGIERETKSLEVIFSEESDEERNLRRTTQNSVTNTVDYCLLKQVVDDSVIDRLLRENSWALTGSCPNPQALLITNLLKHLAGIEIKKEHLLNLREHRRIQLQVIRKGIKSVELSHPLHPFGPHKRDIIENEITWWTGEESKVISQLRELDSLKYVHLEPYLKEQVKSLLLSQKSSEQVK